MYSSDIIIRELDFSNDRLVDEALQLMNRTQGNGLFNREYLARRSNHSDALSLCAFHKGKLASVGCAEFIDTFDYYVAFEPDIVARLIKRKVGSLSTLCVHETLQGNGIGQIMTRKRINWIRKQKRDLILGISWLSGLEHTSNRVFEKLGFRSVGTSHDFFKAGSLAHPFDCPGCNKQPCECGATLYELDLLK